MNIFEQMRDMGANAPRLNVIVSGAGAGLQQRIWGTSGVSNFFVGAEMPYSTEETSRVLGFVPEKFVSTDTAIDMAMAAYVRAWSRGHKAIGLGMTCSVASTREHRGDHRIIAATFDEEGCTTVTLTIPKGVGDQARFYDGVLADELGEKLLERCISGCVGWDFPECVVDVRDATAEARERLFLRPLFRADGSRGSFADIDPVETLEFAGAFNPPHPGHFGAAGAAARKTAKELHQFRSVLFSTCTTHPIKPAMTTAECLQRAAMMRGHDFIVTRGDGLYIEKARRSPGTIFAMGADALNRMLDPRWGNVEDLLSEFYELGIRFMVSRRKQGDDVLDCYGVINKRMSPASRSMHRWRFTPVDFQLDLSSTELRTKEVAK